jgi:hypothetical protein
MKHSTSIPILSFFLAAVTWTPHAAFAQTSSASTAAEAGTKQYSSKNGVLNLKAIILGGGFRVTTVIPLHGDFSRYGHLEIVQAESLIGKAAPLEFLKKLGKELKSEFERGGRFGEVRIVDTFKSPLKKDPASASPEPGDEAFGLADDIDAPMRSADDMLAFDKQRSQAEAKQKLGTAPEQGTLVIRAQVIDYAKGNKLLQLSQLDLGNSILTLRFSYFDKETGEELGRSLISSDNSSKILPSVLSPRTIMSGVAEGLVDQITRRQVAAER